MNRKISRNESQVSKDFKATLRKVLHFSSHREIKQRIYDTTSDKMNQSDVPFWTQSYSDPLFVHDRVSNGQKIKRSSTLNHESKPLYGILNEIVAVNKVAEILPDRNSKILVEPLQSDIVKEGSLKPLKRANSTISNKNKKKIHIKDIFSPEKYSVPFESTGITDLSFNLTIIVENQENILLKVFTHYTIDRLIHKIAKRRSFQKGEIALLYQNSRLESNMTLSWCKINSKSKVYLKILKQVKLIGIYLGQDYPIYIYTSEKISDLKTLFSKEINLDDDLINLKYKEIFLDDNKSFFLYDIPDGGTVNILRKTSSTSTENPDKTEKSPGFELSQTFRNMTNKLQICNCEEKRYNAIACCLLSYFDANHDKHNCLQLLPKFGSDYHLKTCFKSNSKRRPSVIKIDDDPNSEVSVAEVSLTDSIHDEIERIRKYKKINIENSDLENLYQAKSFRTFKRLLRDKIGTKSNLSSVSMLYLYARSLVTYINTNKKSDEDVERILKFINQYFLKYFEKSIIAKGGLTNFTLTETKENTG